MEARASLSRHARGRAGPRIAFGALELARSAGAEIAGTVFQMRDVADPATLVGRGKLDEIRAEATAHKAPLIIFEIGRAHV